MPRDLPVGNGTLLINFDSNYGLRDIYFPHVGQENQTNGHLNRFGVWIDDQFSWVESDEWHRDLRYQDETLVTNVICRNDRLQVELRCTDAVDIGRNLYLKRIEVRNLTGRFRSIRLFQHLDLYLWGNSDGDTAFWDPETGSVVCYKGRRYLLLGGMTQSHSYLTRFATGRKGVHGLEGCWRDAEDGQLGGNPITQGAVDCVGGLELLLPGNGTEVAHFWIAAAFRYDDVRDLHQLVVRRGADSFIDRTAHYWRAWVNKHDHRHLDCLPPAVVRLYKQSALILRTQCDHDGAIIAATDADILQFGRDTYSYMWPRDGALVAHALIRAGHSRSPRAFFEFCASVLTKRGFFLHKYNPDGSAGSSWHPWVAPDGSSQLPIQEDETALVIWALWRHLETFHDVEYIGSLYRNLIVAVADFLCTFISEDTGLPLPSYDLWEERHGISTFTVSAVVAGIESGAKFAESFGETEKSLAYRTVASRMRKAARELLFDHDRGHLSRMVNIRADGRIERDSTLDSSLTGAFIFGLFDIDDPVMIQTMASLEARLWCKTDVGGVARYEDDYYHQTSRDLDRVPGNPWFICTLWLASWHIRRAESLEALDRGKELIEWVTSHARPSGSLAEQVNPYTGAPISVSPLTWSHATYIETVHDYIDQYRKLTDARNKEAEKNAG